MVFFRRKSFFDFSYKWLLLCYVHDGPFFLMSQSLCSNCFGHLGFKTLASFRYLQIIITTQFAHGFFSFLYSTHVVDTYIKNKLFCVSDAAAMWSVPGIEKEILLTIGEVRLKCQQDFEPRKLVRTRVLLLCLLSMIFFAYLDVQYLVVILIEVASRTGHLFQLIQAKQKVHLNNARF